MLLKEHEIYKGFYYCPFANETIVHPIGEAISLRTNKKLPKWYDKNNNMVKILIHHDNNVKYMNLPTLVGRMFINVPEQLKNKKICIYQDSDDKYDMSNLKWCTYKEVQEIAFNKKRDFFKQKFKLPDYINNLDFYDKEPIKCEFKPGYYYIPFTKAAIVINKNGDLFNLETNLEHPCTIDKKGYKVTQLGSDNFKSTWRVHRIVGLIFIKKPIQFKDISFQQLEINHKNCNKIDNLVDNLEWTTTYENMRHAWGNNLVNTNKIVLVRNILTNEVREIFSISECAKEFKLDNSVFHQHLNSSSAGRIIRYNNVFQLKEKFTTWPDKLMTEVYFNKFRPFCRFVFINTITNETLLFFSLPDACKYLKLNINTLKNNKTRHGLNKSTNNWLYITFKEYLDDKGKEI